MAVACVGGCLGSPSDDQGVLDAIEESVVLPSGARKLNEYARYYSKGPDDSIVAVFILPALIKPEECELFNEDPTLTSVVPCGSGMVKPIQAGQRQWLEDWRNLPWVHDRNCGDITVLYDRRKRLFTEVRCPGAAEDYEDY